MFDLSAIPTAVRQLFGFGVGWGTAPQIPQAPQPVVVEPAPPPKPLLTLEELHLHLYDREFRRNVDVPYDEEPITFTIQDPNTGRVAIGALFVGADWYVEVSNFDTLYTDPSSNSEGVFYFTSDADMGDYNGDIGDALRAWARDTFDAVFDRR